MSYRYELALALACASFCLILQHSSEIFSYFVRFPIVFYKVHQDHLQADIHELPSGTYFVSTGQTRVPCEITVDNKIVDSTKSEIESILRKQTLGAAFKVHSEEKKRTIDIRCDSPPGLGLSIGSPLTSIQPQGHNFDFRFNNLPVITSYKSGIVLHLWRSISAIVLGPVFSLFLLFSVIIDILYSKQVGNYDTRRNAYLAFSVCALMYSFAVSDFLRLFTDSVLATIFTRSLRHIFSMSFIFLVSSYAFHRPIIYTVHTLSLLATIISGFLDPEIMRQIFWFQILLMTVCTWISSIDLINKNTDSTSMTLIRLISLTWSILQTAALFLLYFVYNTLVTPAFTAMIAWSLVLIRYRERVQVVQENQKIVSELNTIRELEALAARVAHDIRSPIAALKSLQVTLSNDKNSDELVSSIISRITSIADDLLIRRKRNSIISTNFSALVTLTTKLIEEKKREFRIHPRLKLSLFINNSHESTILIDPNLYQRILSNLINNSAEATSLSGEVNIRLLSDSFGVSIEIEDNGKGMSEEEISKLLNSRGLTYKSDGHGIGLSSAIQIITQWNGRIDLKSKSGHGLLISIRLK